MSPRERRRFRFSIATVLVFTLGIGIGLMVDDFARWYFSRETAPDAQETAAQETVVLIGAIQKPGHYEFQQPTTVVDALAMAGGLEKSADLRRVVLQRSTPGGSTSVMSVDVELILSGRLPADSIKLHDGDIITVPQKPRASN